MLTILFAALLCGCAAVTDGTKRLRAGGSGANGHQHRSFIVRRAEVQQNLIVCNAYAEPRPLDIYQVEKKELLTGDSPLAYKECREFLIPLEEGDQLDFKAGGSDVGTFYATGLPKTSSSLILIPHRRNAGTKAISFDSHAFTDLSSPQIAVIDAYRGKMKSAVKIVENLGDTGDAQSKQQPIEEDLRFNSVVAINPGRYEIKLDGVGAPAKPLLAQSHAKIVVMRTGGETGGNRTNYPQELIVFPNGASPMARLSVVLTVLLGAVAVSFTTGH